MDGSKFTSRSVEVINAAHTAAVTAGNSQVEPVHLAVALLRQENGLAPSLLTRAGADVEKLSHELDEVAWNLPKATGATVQTPTTSPALTRVLAKAIELAAELKDEYVATENLLTALSIVDSPVKEELLRAGVTEASLREVIANVRGNRRVTSQDAEASYEALEKYAVDLTERAEEGKLDPVIGRDSEIRRVVQVLSRRTKNNPVLIGEPGVGKTAVVERARSTAASSRSASRPSSRRSSRPRARSSRSSTSCTRSSVPAPVATRRWTRATCSSRCWRAASSG
jgi:ATP-dependent Clp protease ATP-binding subunit ClpB